MNRNEGVFLEKFTYKIGILSSGLLKTYLSDKTKAIALGKK